MPTAYVASTTSRSARPRPTSHHVIAEGDTWDAVVAAGAEGPRRRGKGLLHAALVSLPRSPRHPSDGLQHGLVHDRSPLAPLQDFVAALCSPVETATGDG